MPGPRTPPGPGAGLRERASPDRSAGLRPLGWVGGKDPCVARTLSCPASADLIRVLQAIPEGRRRCGVRIPHIHRINQRDR